MKILVINAGSSSLKYQLFDTDTKDVLAKGLCERIGLDGNVKHSVPGQEDFVKEMPMKDHGAAIRIVIELLTQGNTAVLTSLSEIDAVGHRVLHGGAEFTESVIVDDRVIDAIRKCIPLGPLHNPANLTGILACSEVMEGIPQVAVFDTAFHQTMPEKAYLYALLTSIMKSTVCGVMGSMEPPTATFPRRQRRLWASRLKISKSLYAISVMAHPFQL